MEPLRCPQCDAPLRARREDPWEIIRALAAVHLRRCPKGTRDQREIAMLAIKIADEAAPGSGQT
ncbi:MAG TPA: hypothetical protein VLV78_13390 [Thermoanaerobaculia bacterium]|nr:hypothetical protein [Thermoanaerobaculia bacterium]